ncbi:TetR/AcrR family transcriptional regulator [Streptomyces sp. NPDC017435]|uniref:TetR/AcrR family transcriptional regulator n=1 Tax=Streptomyces sp. NPDC017435 TaxID=3364995 RepID=UPI0037BB4BAC
MPVVRPYDRAVSEGTHSAEREAGGVECGTEHRHTDAVDHRVRLDHEFVDLAAQLARQAGPAAQVDVETAVLRLQLADLVEQTVRDDLDVRGRRFPLMARATRDRGGCLALLEMRLEATRRPELRASFTTSVRGDLEHGMTFHRDAGLPGGDETVVVLYLAMLGLILEHLTLPGVLDGALPGVSVPEDLVERIVATVVPEAP